MPIAAKDSCFMLRKPTGFGGNKAFENLLRVEPSGGPITVRRTAAFGDSIAATIIADRLHELGYSVTWQTTPMIHSVLWRHPTIVRVEAPNGHCDVDLDGCYENDPERSKKAFWDMFLDRANEQLAHRGIKLHHYNSKPRLDINKHSQLPVLRKMEEHPRPWTIICPRSNFYNVRWIADGVWQDIASQIEGTKFWIGTHSPAPAGIVDLNAKHIDHVVEWIGAADLMVTVDTGPMHIASALNTPLVVVEQSNAPSLRLNNQNDFVVVSAPLDCLNCQKNKCPVSEWKPPCNYIDPAIVSTAANLKLRGEGKVSCVIPTWKAPVERLNECIRSVVDQVEEVVVSVDIRGIIPQGAMEHPKVRYVRRPPNIGRNSFAANCNFGARHTNCEFVHFLNDDCYLMPEAIKACMDMMHPEVGLVGHLLRYGPKSPRTGRINHGGKFRSPNMPCFSLYDWGEWHPTIKQPIEVECVTGTSILVRRKALYDIGGWNEEYQFYGEDDDFSMEMRHHGWKIVYTPHAMAIHDEAQTTFHTGRLNEWMNHGHALLSKRWKAYFDYNKDRIPGDFLYLQKL